MNLGIKVQIIEKITKLSIGFVVFALIARSLGPENFGKLNIIFALIGSILFLHHFGVNELLSKDLTIYPRHVDTLLTSALSLRFTGACVAYFLLQIFGFFYLDDIMLSAFLLVASLSIFFYIFDSIQSFFISRGLGRKIAKYKFLSFIIVSSIRLILIYYDADYYWYFFPFILEPFFLAMFLALGIRNENIILKFELSKKHYQRYIYRGMPIAISVLVVSLSLRLDQMIIANYLSFSDVGVYGAAVRFIEAWYIIPSVVCMSLMPVLIKLRIHSHTIYNTSISLLILILTLSYVILAAGALVFLDDIVFIVLGDEYEASLDIIFVLGIGGLIVTHGTIFSTWQVIEKKQKYRLYCQLFGLVANGLISVVLVKSHGTLGVAVGTISGFAIANYVMPLIFQQTRRFVSILFMSALNVKLIFILPLHLVEVRKLKFGGIRD